MFRFQTLEDCPLEEDGDALHGLAEEDEDIDQYNDDTFGAGAIDDDWQEEHERLAEMEEKLQGGREEERNSSMDFSLLGDENFAECISKLVVNSEGSELYDPAIMKAIHSRPPLQPASTLNSSIWEGPSLFGRIQQPLLSQTEESPLLSLIKDVGLPKRPPLGREDERDLSECVLPPRSSSPIIGSPPVRTAPIGTPPKQPMMPPFNQQKILCPTPVHIRAPLQQRYPTPFNERMSPNQLVSVTNSSLRGHPFPPSVNPVLTQLQRAQLMGTSQQTGRMSPSHFARVSGLVGGPLTQMNPKLMQGRMGQMMPAFRPFFGPHPHPPHPSQGHLQNMRSQQQMFRADTTHLHPQHRRLLSQRQQQNRNQHTGQNGAGGDRHHRGSHHEQIKKDPYSNLMTQREKEWVSKIQMMQLQSTDPYLDDYYYQNYFEKLEKRPQPVDSNGDGPKKEHTKLITPQVAKLEHTYKPVQFEGSLGKLTVSSVNNPRKMIDAVVTTRTDDDETKEKQVRDKRRHTLYTIERTYSLLLDIQDFEKRFLQVPEEERGALLEQRRQKLLEMYESLRGKPSGRDRPSDDLFVQVMCIRKGKHLVARALPYFTAEQAATIVMATARNLPFLIKKDVQDEVLPCLVKPCSLLISQLPPSALTGLLQQLTNLPHSTQSSNHIAALLQNKFGLTLLYVILSHGERLHSSNAALELMEDNRWMELVLGVARELLKIPQSSLTKPTFTPANLLSLFSRFVDRQSLNLLETKLQLSPKPR
ncbi:protein PAT1 homolog 1 isoform X1 [Latimeria chalumnae]|uniref:protein PAT1 homolog 1 isoform X1 n=2 Tax=Latimeria chalumnae TaxID=7897 RepID=UPI00313CEDB0